MRNKVFRVIVLLLALSLLLSTIAFAAMNASDYIGGAGAWISRDGDTVEVNYYIIGTSSMDQIGLKYIFLYEKNGNTWSLVKFFSYNDPLYSATLMAQNIDAHSGYVSYSGAANKQYYASCWFYAEKGGGSDSSTQNAY